MNHVVTHRSLDTWSVMVDKVYSFEEYITDTLINGVQGPQHRKKWPRRRELRPSLAPRIATEVMELTVIRVLPLNIPKCQTGSTEMTRRVGHDNLSDIHRRRVQ